jgi:hypothetical protein
MSDDMRIPGAVTDLSTISESPTVAAEDGHRLPLHVARPVHPLVRCPAWW